MAAAGSARARKAAAQARRRNGRARRRNTSGARREHFRNLHPPSHRHQPADAAIALFGVIAYRALAVSDLPQVDYPTITRQRQPAWRQSRDHGFRRGHAPGAPVHHHRRPGFHGLHQQPGLHQHHPAIRSRAAISMAPPSTSKPPSPKPCRCCRPACPRRLPSARSTPAISPSSASSSPRPPCAFSDLDEYAETMIAQRISMVDGVAQVQVFGSTKYAVRVQVDPNELASRGRSASTKSMPPSRTGTSTSPPARSTAPRPPTTCRPTAS